MVCQMEQIPPVEEVESSQLVHYLPHCARIRSALSVESLKL